MNAVAPLGSQAHGNTLLLQLCGVKTRIHCEVHMQGVRLPSQKQGEAAHALSPPRHTAWETTANLITQSSLLKPCTSTNKGSQVHFSVSYQHFQSVYTAIHLCTAPPHKLSVLLCVFPARGEGRETVFCTGRQIVGQIKNTSKRAIVRSCLH